MVGAGPRAVVMILVPLAIAWLAGGPADASNGAGVSVGVKVRPSPTTSPIESAASTSAPAILSITVSPGSITFGGCKGGTSTATALGFPNGSCTTSVVTITNAGGAAHIRVRGGAATPIDGGRQWTLCGGKLNSVCTGPKKKPGTDQYEDWVVNKAKRLLLSATAQCDVTINSTCSLRAKASVQESLAVVGPLSSTDASSSFSTVVVWTAVA